MRGAVLSLLEEDKEEAKLKLLAPMLHASLIDAWTSVRSLIRVMPAEVTGAGIREWEPRAREALADVEGRLEGDVPTKLREWLGLA